MSVQVSNRGSVCFYGISRSMKFCFYGNPFSGNGGKFYRTCQLCGRESGIFGDSFSVVRGILGAAVLEKNVVTQKGIGCRSGNTASKGSRR